VCHIAEAEAVPPGEFGDQEPNPLNHYLQLADLALLKNNREEQRIIKEKIRPQVERYRKLTTGRKRYIIAPHCRQAAAQECQLNPGLLTQTIKDDKVHCFASPV
jgi:hypothetical protein